MALSVILSTTELSNAFALAFVSAAFEKLGITGPDGAGLVAWVETH